MAEFEELRITVNLVDNASAGLGQIRAQLHAMESISRASATALQATTAAVTGLGAATTNATKSVQTFTQQSNAANRAAQGLTGGMRALATATNELERGFRGLAIASQRDLATALPLIGTGVANLAMGMRTLTAGLGEVSTATRVAAIGIGSIGIALLAGAAAYGAYQVSVFNFAKEIRGLGDSARAMGVSFATLRHATVEAQRFGLAQEAIISSFQGMQKAMTDLYQGNSGLRRKLISEGLDPEWLHQWESQTDELERLSMAQQQIIAVRNEHLARGATQAQARGIASQFARDIGVDPRLQDKPMIRAMTPQQRQEYEKVAEQSKRAMESWDRISARIEGLKSRLFSIGLPGLERSMERLENWLKTIKDEDVEAFFRGIGTAVEKVSTFVGGSLMQFARDLKQIFQDIKAIYDYFQQPAVEKRIQQQNTTGQEERNKRGHWENFEIEVLGKKPGGAAAQPGAPAPGGATERSEEWKAQERRRLGGVVLSGPTPGTAGAPAIAETNDHLKNLNDNLGELNRRSGADGPFEGRALGGPVKGGRSYIVGERGPELFSPPGAGGRISPDFKDDEHDELIEEQSEILTETNQHLKKLNDYFDSLRARSGGGGIGSGAGTGGDPATGGAGVGTGGGAATAPMGPGGGPSNVPGVVAPSSGGGGPTSAPPSGGPSNVTPGEPGTMDRSSLLKEAQDPAMAQRLQTIVQGEVGHRASNQKKQIQLETIFNRAIARGQTLAEVTQEYTGKGSKGYYPRSTFIGGKIKSQEQIDQFQKDILAPVLAGSDESTKALGFPATGNASAGVAARGAASGRYQRYGQLEPGKRPGDPGVETYVQQETQAQRARLDASRRTSIAAAPAPDAAPRAPIAAAPAPAAAPRAPIAAAPSAGPSNIPGVDGQTGVVRERQEALGATRKYPVTEAVRAQLAAAGVASGTNVDVTSGGQLHRFRLPSGKMTSHRHTGGGAGDVQMIDPVTKKPLSLNNRAHRARIEEGYVAAFRAGAEGIGAGTGYMGTETHHIGGGGRASWGGEQAIIERARKRATALGPYTPEQRQQFAERSRGRTQVAGATPTPPPTPEYPQEIRDRLLGGRSPPGPGAGPSAVQGSELDRARADLDRAMRDGSTTVNGRVNVDFNNAPPMRTAATGPLFRGGTVTTNRRLMEPTGAPAGGWEE